MLFFSFVKRYDLIGPSKCQFLCRPRPCPPILLVLCSHRGSAFAPPPPRFYMWKKPIKRRGRGPCRPALHPHLVASRSIIYACFHFCCVLWVLSVFLPPLSRYIHLLRGAFSWKSRKGAASRLPSRWPTPQTSAIFNPLSLSDCCSAELSCCGGSWRGVEFVGEVESDGCHPTIADYNRYIVE